MGTGERVVFCFHGYGEDATGFTFLENTAGDEFTFYALDLPFHGKTEWREKGNFKKEDLAAIVNSIIQEHVNSKICLLGFSLGGRMALSLFQAIPDRVEKLVLLAPDGLKINFWYWLATQTSVGNQFFRYTMKRPGWFFGFLRGMNKLKLVNASIFKFVNFYISDKPVREALYKRWTSLGEIKPGLKKIKSLIRINKIPVRLLYGKYDRIILSARGEKFRKGIEATCSIRVINSGHQLLHEKHAREIVESIML